MVLVSFQECDILFLPFLEDGVYNISEATIGGTKTPLMVAGQWTVVSNSITVQEVEEQLDVHVIRYLQHISSYDVLSGTSTSKW